MIRGTLAIAIALASVPAWSQPAAAPAFGPDAPWAQAYFRCANDALERDVAAAAALQPAPWPEQTIPPAERECAGEVPAADSLGVRATVALVHGLLQHRFGPGRSLALAPRPPLRLPDMLALDNGVACPRPDYPPAALRAQAQGTSLVEVTFDQQGQLVDGKLVGASGPTREHRMLDRAALESFALCQVPASGTPGNRPLRTAYHWRIDGDAPPATGAKP